MSERPPMQEVERYSFYRSSGLDDDLKKKISSEIRHASKYEGVETLPEQTKEMQDIAWEVLGPGIEEWYRDKLQLDVRSRITSVYKIGVVTQEELNKHIATHPGEDVCTAGLCNDVSDILLADNESRTQMVGYLNHELIHSYDHRDVNATGTPGNMEINLVSLGIDNRALGKNPKTKSSGKSPLKCLNEGLVELRNIECQRQLQERHPELNYLKDYHPGYHKIVIFFDALISTIVKRRGEQARFDLYRACVTGDRTKLRVFNEIFGPKSLKIISGLETSLTFQRLREILVNDIKVDDETLGVFDESVATYRNTDRVELQILKDDNKKQPEAPENPG